MDELARFLLEFTHENYVLAVVIIGYIWISRTIFFDGLKLIFLGMIFNFALKCTFEVPLLPTLGKRGFAFPSGHMQLAVSLYGWLAYQFKNIYFSIIVLALLGAIGISLVYCGYHDYVDVIGAINSGLVLLIFYNFIKRQRPELLIEIIMATSGLLIIYISLHYGQLPRYIWLAAYALMGILVGEKVFKNNADLLLIHQKIIATHLSFTLTFLLKFLANAIHLNKFPMYISELQWLLMGFMIPYIPYLVAKKINIPNKVLVHLNNIHERWRNRIKLVDKLKLLG